MPFEFRVSNALAIVAVTAVAACAKEWDATPIPAEAGPGRQWRLIEAVSDDFNYDFEPASEIAEVGGKWRNHYFGYWQGPGTTVWRHENVAVAGGRLRIRATREPGETKVFREGGEEHELPVTRLGCISSLETVRYPMFAEARVKIPNAVLASNVWLLSRDSTQEIDILESYGGPGDDRRSEWLSQRIHLSHHVFIRRPFQDYQPSDASTWYTRPNLRAKPGRGYWTEEYHRVGVYWRDPTHLEYYIDGELVKVTSGLDGSDDSDGIDPVGYTKDESGVRTGLSKPMHVIINMEAQSWNAAAGRHPTDAELRRQREHTYLVDWFRAYRPVEESLPQL